MREYADTAVYSASLALGKRPFPLASSIITRKTITDEVCQCVFQTESVVLAEESRDGPIVGAKRTPVTAMIVLKI